MYATLPGADIAQEKENKKTGFITSIVLHMMLLLLLFLIPMAPTEKIQDTFQGIMVTFGDVEAGDFRNNNENSTPIIASESEEKEEKEMTAEKQKVKPVETIIKESPSKTPVIESKISEEKSPIEVKSNLQTKITENKSNNSNSDVAEKSNQSTEESEQKKLEETKSKFGALFGQGSTGKVEDEKGEEFGRADASILEGLSKGTGEAGEGLDSRKIIFQPEITDQSQKTGKVVVKVCVNNLGNVISAKYTQRGSTTTDQHLANLATDGAKKYKFSPNDVPEQCGIITINFIVH